MSGCFYAEAKGKLAYLIWKENDRIHYAAPGPFGEELATFTAASADPPTVENLTADFARELGDKWSYPIHRRALPAGVFHPRIWRPVRWGPGERGKNLAVHRLGGREPLRSGITTATILFDHFGRIARTVEPSRAQLTTYGHEIRHLLLLACMEVEAAWTGVLRANGVTKVRLTTQDYVQLLAPMRLAEWALRLTQSPDEIVLRPFEHWQPSAPTKSLDWYDSYNATKHDRETKIHRATLGAAITAIAGLYAMLAAQFSKDACAGPEFGVFQVVSEPAWPLDEVYIPSHMPLGEERRKWDARPLF